MRKTKIHFLHTWQSETNINNLLLYSEFIGVVSNYYGPLKRTGTCLHAAGRLPMSTVHSMNARKCVHAQKPYPSQAVAHESSKVGGREKKRDRKDRGQEADGKKGSPTKQKHI